MKILHCLNHFLPQQTAGTEVYTWALSKQLQLKGVEVGVVIPNYGKVAADSYQYDGINVFQYAEPSVVDRSLIMGFRQPDGLAAFNDHLKSAKPDIVHFHELAGSNGITLQHVLDAKKNGAKVVMTFHLARYTCITGKLFYKEKECCDGRISIQKCSSCYLHSKGNGWFNSLLLPVSSVLYQLGINTTRWNNRAGTALGTAFIIDELRKKFELLVQHCDKVVVLTDWYKKILLLNGVPAEKICFVPQGLPFDVAIQSTIETRKAIPLKLIFLGRINPFKGLHLLLEAISNMDSQQVELDIYGNSDDAGYETFWHNKTSAQKNINWKGKLQQTAVVHTMQQYDALCLPSEVCEMAPLVIQEAFAAGIPVIASNVYGNAEQIEDGVNGWLFKFKDSNELKNKLQLLINNPDLIAKARRNIKPVKSFAEVANEYVKLYKEILAIL